MTFTLKHQSSTDPYQMCPSSHNSFRSLLEVQLESLKVRMKSSSHCPPPSFKLIFLTVWTVWVKQQMFRDAPQLSARLHRRGDVTLDRIQETDGGFLSLALWSSDPALMCRHPDRLTPNSSHFSWRLLVCEWAQTHNQRWRRFMRDGRQTVRNTKAKQS